MSIPDKTHRSLQWLAGVALIDAADPLPMRACASKSALRVAERSEGARTAATAATAAIEVIRRDLPGLRLIFNDDHGMTPSVTIVNQTARAVTLRAVRPAVLSTDNGTYDLDALLASGPRTIEPGHPLVIRITDIGRNVDEPFRVGATVSDGRRIGPPAEPEDCPSTPGANDPDGAPPRCTVG